MSSGLLIFCFCLFGLAFDHFNQRHDETPYQSVQHEPFGDPSDVICNRTQKGWKVRRGHEPLSALIVNMLNRSCDQSILTLFNHLCNYLFFILSQSFRHFFHRHTQQVNIWQSFPGSPSPAVDCAFWFCALNLSICPLPSSSSPLNSPPATE